MFSGPNCRKERGRSNVLDLSKYRCSPAHRLPTDQALARCLSPRRGGVSRSFYLDSSFPVLLKHSAPYIDPSTTKRPKNSLGLCTKNKYHHSFRDLLVQEKSTLSAPCIWPASWTSRPRQRNTKRNRPTCSCAAVLTSTRPSPPDSRA